MNAIPARPEVRIGKKLSLNLARQSQSTAFNVAPASRLAAAARVRESFVQELHSTRRIPIAGECS